MHRSAGTTTTSNRLQDDRLRTGWLLRREQLRQLLCREIFLSTGVQTSIRSMSMILSTLSIKAYEPVRYVATYQVFDETSIHAAKNPLGSGTESCSSSSIASQFLRSKASNSL